MTRYATPVLAAMAAVCLAAAVAPAQEPPIPTALPEGYLTQSEELDSTMLVPAPPADGSPAQALDLSQSERTRELIDTARWRQAQEDAEIRPPNAVRAFSCAAGIDLQKVEAPQLVGLLTRSSGDLARAPRRAKARYQRSRPFVVNGRASCTPERDRFQRQDGSYPSGHAAIGWGWALILSELIPERAEQLLARGREFGDSRVVCNAHWQSDVEEGRILGAATVARLHANPQFNRDLEQAKAELANWRQSSLPEPAGCEAIK